MTIGVIESVFVRPTTQLQITYTFTTEDGQGFNLYEYATEEENEEDGVDFEYDRPWMDFIETLREDSDFYSLLWCASKFGDIMYEFICLNDVPNQPAAAA